MFKNSIARILNNFKWYRQLVIGLYLADRQFDPVPVEVRR